MQDFKKLKVWPKSFALTIAIKRAVKSFPPEEQHESAGQLRRSASSIHLNIAEGAAKGGDHEFKRFAKIALGSVFDVEAQLLEADKLSYLAPAEFERLNLACHEVRRMLVSFIRRLEASIGQH